MKKIKIKTHKTYVVVGNILLDDSGNSQEFKNKSKMAEFLGITRQSLHNKLNAIAAPQSI